MGGEPAEEVQAMMTAAFRGVVPPEARFLGGETIGALVERAAAEIDAIVADADWDVALLVLHGGVNRAILSRALTGERVFIGGFEQAPGCIDVLDVGPDGEWIVRAVNHIPYDHAHVAAPRLTTMEQLWEEYLGSRG